mgnify:CR=1 FL=1
MAKEKKLVEAITSMEEDFRAMVYGCCEESGVGGLYQRERLYGD